MDEDKRIFTPVSQDPPIRGSADRSNDSDRGRRQSGFLRLSSILGPDGPIPVSKSTWWDGVRSGKFPKPVKISKNITEWRKDDIAALIDSWQGAN